MSNRGSDRSMHRREFIKTSAAATVAGSSLLGANAASGEAGDDGLIHRNERPDRMLYRKLGRTNFMSSRLVFGCAVVKQSGDERLIERVYESGVNHFEAGSDSYYKGVEKAIAPFVKAHRDDIFLASKGSVRAGFGKDEAASVTVEQAKESAAAWVKLLDGSLTDLGCDHIDAYYIMMVDQPALLRCEEMYNAFLKAKAAGKVRYFGVSTHRRAGRCLEAAMETGWYDLAMIAITPAGWYQMAVKTPPKDVPALKDLRPLLDRARTAGMGIVGMKGGVYVASGPKRGETNDSVFDHLYDQKLMAAPFNGFQRSYAYVLEHGLDVVTADMRNFKQFEENLLAARTGNRYFA